MNKKDVGKSAAWRTDRALLSEQRAIKGRYFDHLFFFPSLRRAPAEKERQQEGEEDKRQKDRKVSWAKKLI